jgi:hypothetical protein
MRYIAKITFLNVINVITVTTNLFNTTTGFYKPVSLWSSLFFRLYCDRAYPQQSFDDKQLYKWKDLVSSLSLGIGSAVVAALVKTVAVILVLM